MNENEHSPGSQGEAQAPGRPPALPAPGVIAEHPPASHQRVNEQRLASAFQLSPAATAIIRCRDLLGLEANESFLRMFECAREEITGRTLFETGLLDAGAVHELSQKLNGTGIVAGVELEAHTQHGKALRIHLCMRVIETGGENCALMTMFDLTEAKQATKERQAGATPVHIAQMEAKVFKISQSLHLANLQLEASKKELEAFTHAVSHDLRAPLRGIDGYVRMLGEDYSSLLDAEGHRLLGVVSSETRRMGRLIDGLLAFSNLGRRHMEHVPVDMTGLAQAAFESVSSESTPAAMRFELRPLPPAIGDLSMLRQVFLNLLSNAVKFSRNAPTALIEVGSLSESPAVEPLQSGESLYYVRDNGAGFDERYREKLFGVFQRLHSETQFEGTGVGLALVQRIVGRHGGRVWAEGKVGAGATFYFTLANSNGAEDE